MAKKSKPRKQAISNRKAHFNYEELDSIDVGMALTGDEIKAIRAGHVQLAGSYGRILQGPKQPELWLVGSQMSVPTGDKMRSRKLLAHRAEIDRLIGMVQQKGYTLVPERIFLSRGRAKLKLLVSRGLKTHEKRRKLQERDLNRDIARSLRGR